MKASLLPILALVACGRVFEYPEPEPEQSAALCADSIDNDYDGQSDCNDAECVGFCAEESRTACSDGLDNDGDGLVDAADVRCWPLLTPKTARCAEASGIDMVESFDRYLVSLPDAFPGAWPWQLWGGEIGHTYNAERGDYYWVFSPVAAQDTGSSGLAVLVRLVPFSGSWSDFELSFTSFVPAAGLVRAAIVPVELAPATRAPAPGVEDALLSLSVDNRTSPPSLVLVVDGVSFAETIQCSEAEGPCTDLSGRASIRFFASGSFQAELVLSDGSKTVVRGAAPVRASVPPSRLVLWGGAVASELPAWVDDLSWKVAPEQPCGFVAPQIGGLDCASREGAFGQTVSVTRAHDGTYCALVAAAPSEPDAGPTLPAPQVLMTWSSSDGEAWREGASLAAPLVSLPKGAALVGGAIVADGATLRAVVAYRKGEDVELGFVEGESCDDWGELESGPVLFPDAEAPSYVIDGARHELYFTRAPRDEPRSLWRVVRDAPDVAPERLWELPASVGAPVNVQRAGTRDLVMTYPTSGEGNAGIGLRIADATRKEWLPVSDGPLLEAAPRPGLWEGEGRLAFDDRGVVSAALVWDDGGGFLIYGGNSTSGRVHAAFDQLQMAVGTARIAMADSTLPEKTAVVPNACGDGICGVGENTETCTDDCPASGRSIATDALKPDASWQLLTAAPLELADHAYVDEAFRGLNWVPNGTVPVPSWSVLSLGSEVLGDFELSFDALAPWVPNPKAVLYFGLASVDGTAPLEPLIDGIFVHLDRDYAGCVEALFASPLVVSEASSSEQPMDPMELRSCAGNTMVVMNTWQRVVLRRRGDEVSLATLMPNGCGMSERKLDVAKDLPPLSSLVIGCGGPGFLDCIGFGALTIRNLQLVVPEDSP